MNDDRNQVSLFGDTAGEGTGDPGPARRPRRRWKGGLASCLVVLLVLGGLAAGGAVLVTYGMHWFRDAVSGPDDYSGSGSGTVLVQVHEGDTTADIARRLERAGVVKSAEAFTGAAADDSRALGIQVGFYQLHHKMSAASALKIMVDPDNLVQTMVTIPEGLRVSDTIARLARRTDISAREYRRALGHPKALGLPPYAHGNAEGYLFPATYAVPPNATGTSVLRSMVDRWRQAADEAQLAKRARALGYTPGELMTVASLVEAETNRDEYRGKVARVIYNRLETDATNHMLQIDATVNYALGRDLGLALTPQQLQVDSPYNTRRYPGLPPGPIESPGDAAIAAAAHPTPGDWVYYVTVNLDTGETKFATTYDEFLRYKRQLRRYCAQSPRC